MRIAILNAHRAQAGGIETYLHTMIPALAAAGHHLAFLHRYPAPPDIRPISLPDESPVWCTTSLGIKPSLAALRGWRPDVAMLNTIDDSAVASAVLATAPTVLFAHGYYGTCVSGTKMFAAPRPMPCNRTMGWRCLLRYYPRRCGGLNPLTMAREYRLESTELARLPRYAAILTASAHMRREYLNHGVPPSRVHLVPYPVTDNGQGQSATSPPQADTPWQLFFSGRMTPLKGGQLMLDALPAVYRELHRPLRVIFAGDGPARGQWEERARRVSALSPGAIEIEFPGWLDAAGLSRLHRQSHLAVVPSVWPEPFGLTGPEAGLHGLPAAAFAVGGIPDWLSDGVNGYLAPGDPPDATALAEAIAKCLRDPVTYARLCAGARLRAAEFTLARHMRILLDVLSRSAGHIPAHR